MRAPKFLLPLGALAVLAGCATTSDDVDVTRFHVAEPAASGRVLLQPLDPQEAGTLEFRTYAEIVAGALERNGFEVVNDRSQANLIGLFDYDRVTREALAERSPVSVGVGGGTFGGNVGVGLGTSFGLGGKKGDIVTNLLELRLIRAADDQVVWEGRATSEARESEAEASPAAALPRLAAGLLRDYPGPSGETVTYKN